jgi:predicted amidohydrolase
MIVAGLQMDIAWEDPEENFARAAELAREAAAGGARMVALPEMFATGFSVRSPAVADHADAIRRFLSDLAREYGVWVLGGYAEHTDARPVNSCSLLTPTGDEVLHYRKVHPFTLAGEGKVFDGGDSIHTAEVEGVRITPLICYDLRFPELFRAAAVQTDLFIVVANWPVRRSYAWRTLLAARAIDCLSWVLGVNRVGDDGEGFHFQGDSALVDPMGEVASSLSDIPGVAAGEVDAARVRELREKLGFLDDRRPDLYARLARDGVV